MARYAILEKIQQLDPQRDHEHIVFLSTCYEFPFDTTRALEFALFRSYCVPSISALLDKTGEFHRRPQRRYDDTDIIISEMMEWGHSSERGQRALLKMNDIHSRFSITNEDFLYVLSTFVFEPIRWNERFGWRMMCEQERLAMFYFWKEVGRQMQIQHLPQTYAGFEEFNRNYEAQHYCYTDANYRVGRATVELFVSWFPRIFSSLVRSSIYALLDESLVKGFGFPQPSPFMRNAVRNILCIRGQILRFFPPRKTPRFRTEMTHPSHPQGYTIEHLGPTHKN